MILSMVNVESTTARSVGMPVFSFMRDVGEGWTAEGYRGRPLCMELTPDQVGCTDGLLLCRRHSAARAALAAAATGTMCRPFSSVPCVGDATIGPVYRPSSGRLVVRSVHLSTL